ncbi:MAG TPA: helix-turn-helix domain-containing protein [Caulobacteraceae bacterium]|nr:helix-turn-helix domain-containing protein [Caulobacteraceae bacterium]
MEGLHKEIGRYLVTYRKGLTGSEIRFLRKTMDLTQAELAAHLGNDSQSVARWEKGVCEIPGPAEKLLRAIFLALVMTEEEATALRELVLSKLQELDAQDEVTPAPAEFSHADKWVERRRSESEDERERELVFA